MEEDRIIKQLRRYALSKRIRYEYCLHRYLQERFLYRLSCSEYQRSFVVRGGTLLYPILDERSIATRDILLQCTTRRYRHAALRTIFTRVCERDGSDGVVFHVMDVHTDDTSKSSPQAICVQVSAMLGHTVKKLPIQITYAGECAVKIRELSYPLIWKQDALVLMTYAWEAILAQRLDAILMPQNALRRIKDFYDIYLISITRSFYGKDVQQAMVAVLHNSKKVLVKQPMIFHVEYRENRRMHQCWNALLQSLGGSPALRFSQVLTHIQDFLFPVYQAILDYETYPRFWNHHEGRWM